MFTSSMGYQLIKKEIGDLLCEKGFLPFKTATFYRVTAGDILQFITFQKGVQSLGEQMTMNVSIQGTFSPTCSFDHLQPGGRIGQFIPSEKDLWWHCGLEDATNESVAAITSNLKVTLLPCLNQLSTAEELIPTFNSGKLSFLWNGQDTFVDRGYIYLKAKRYKEGLAIFQSNRPSKVAKFKTIHRLTEDFQFDKIDQLLQENSLHQKIKWRI